MHNILFVYDKDLVMPKNWLVSKIVLIIVIFVLNHWFSHLFFKYIFIYIQQPFPTPVGCDGPRWVAHTFGGLQYWTRQDKTTDKSNGD